MRQKWMRIRMWKWRRQQRAKPPLCAHALSMHRSHNKLAKSLIMTCEKTPITFAMQANFGIPLTQPCLDDTYVRARTLNQPLICASLTTTSLYAC